MFNFKSQVLNATLAATVAIPVATASLLTSAGSAQAAALTGEFSFNGGFTQSPSATSVVTLKKDSLIFTPDSILAGVTGAKSTPVAITSQTGSFSIFNSAGIGDIISFTNNTVQNPFLDFGSLTEPGRVGTGENTSSLRDNKNTFTLESAKYTLSQITNSKNLSLEVTLFGYFTSASGEITQGQGNLTFQKNNTTLTQANTILANGGSLANLTFSGAAFTTSVPEPTTMLGLGLVGAGMLVSRRRKG